jgi:hypothetical protein
MSKAMMAAVLSAEALFGVPRAHANVFDLELSASGYARMAVTGTTLSVSFDLMELTGPRTRDRAVSSRACGRRSLRRAR